MPSKVSDPDRLAKLLAVPDEADWSVEVYAAKMNVSSTTVQRWIAKKRITTATRRYGTREVLVVVDRTRPEKLKPYQLAGVKSRVQAPVAGRRLPPQNRKGFDKAKSAKATARRKATSRNPLD